MMYEVLGKERFSGTSKKTGKAYDFTRLYCLVGDNIPSCAGNRTEVIDVWSSSDVDLGDVGVGSRIQVYYNKRGYVQDVCVLD